MLRRAKESDIPIISHIHYSELNSDFLSSLGEDFLSLLYRLFLQNKYSSIYVYEQSGNVYGFILGVKDFDKTFKNIIVNNLFKFSIKVLGRVVRKPYILKNIFETFFYVRKEGINLPRTELVAIAVSQKQQSKGIGKKLTKTLEEEYKKNNIKEYKVSVSKQNIIANGFYKSIGFNKENEFRLYGRLINLYTKKIQ
jgi:ribosomal protein S18 acetylase RimI-like enzyme